MNAAIITARSGSESIPQKNILDVCGKELLKYPIEAAKESALVDEVWVSTDGDDIASVSKEAGAQVLRRPDHLQGDVSHGDVIQDAVRTANRKCNSNLETAVILLGNSVMIDSELITMSIDAVSSSSADSAMTVWKAEDDHPQRAMTTNKKGFLQYYDGEYDAENTNRQNYEDIYYYDNGPWTLQPHCVEDQNGPGPWWWMGEKCIAIEREWVTGRDIHDYFDVAFQEFYEQNRQDLQELEERTVLESQLSVEKESK